MLGGLTEVARSIDFEKGLEQFGIHGDGASRGIAAIVADGAMARSVISDSGSME